MRNKAVKLFAFVVAIMPGAAFASEIASHGADHPASSGGLPQLDPSSFMSQLFWLTIVFSFLYIVFKKKSLPEISNVIEGRAERIRSDLDSTQELRSQVEAVQKAYEENLEKARHNALATYKSVEDKIKKDTESEMKSFYERSSKDLTQMEKKVTEAKNKAIKDIDLIAVEVAEDAVTKILGENIKKAKAA